MKNIQILLETVLRCGGTCSGCALASLERLEKSQINWEDLQQRFKDVNALLTKENFDDVESVTVFLGQGDHFLLSDEDIILFMSHLKGMIPEGLRTKSNTFITASAIGKNEDTFRKMDLFYRLSIENKTPFFIQVVFDPKKIVVDKSFKKIYLNNILYFKKKCGMTELTVNLGEDVFNSMNAQYFHDWIIENGFIHVEMNWVFNIQTQQMWKEKSSQMLSWLQDLLILNAKEHLYEINFIPFLSKIINDKKLSMEDVISNIEKSLGNNFYIDSKGNQYPSQVGMINNLIPIKERLSQSDALPLRSHAVKIYNSFMKNKTCSSCQYLNTCAQTGVVSWLKYEKEGKCPSNLKGFMDFLEQYYIDYPELNTTKFNRNPVQNEGILTTENEIYKYFENKFLTKISD